MGRTSRIVVLVASLLLGLVYVLPLWRISLEAPQYPEGLGLVIRVNTITGQKPNDLQNINGLNHYIGMKAIEPDSIPELRLMPWVVALLMLMGVTVAATGRRMLLYVWAAVFLLAAVGGLLDFWLWQYDYGHNLDPSAPIKVPGMTYQPPMLGSKKLLNFRATSWPGVGGWLAIGAFLAAAAVTIQEFRGRAGRREVV